MTTITTENLAVQIDGRLILENITVQFQPGTMTAITGESGSGKSTLLNALGLLLPAASGSVFIDGENTSRWGDRQKENFWRKHAAFIYQDYGVIDEENLFFNVALAQQLAKRYSNEIDAILSKVGLGGRGKSKAAVLSGGEKQRLGIARAIFKNASVIFADEPTASLDPDNAAKVISLLRERAQAGATVVIATHDPALAAECTNQIKL